MSEVKRASDLKTIEGHKNYYRSLKSGIIYYKDSKTPKFSTGETTIGKAKKVVEEKKLLQAGMTPVSAKRTMQGITNPPITELYAEMVKEKTSDVKSTTAYNYMRDWRNAIQPFWGDKFAQDINENNLLKFKTWYLENRSTKYARKAIIHFKMHCKWLFKKKIIKVMPDLEMLNTIHATVEKNARRDVVGRVYDEKTEVLPMLEAAKSVSPHDYLCSRAHLAILLGVRCGMRKESEVLKSKWENLDFKAKTLKVWSEKNHCWRTIPLIEEVIEAFRVQAKFTMALSEWVFPMPSDPKKHITGQVLDKVWTTVKEKAKIRDWNVKGAARFHDLRHTCATRTAEFGWQPVVACEYLDMSLDIYQKTYCHPSTSSIAEMVKRTFENSSYGAMISNGQKSVQDQARELAIAMVKEVISTLVTNSSEDQKSKIETEAILKIKTQQQGGIYG